MTAVRERVRVVIVDDHPIYRQGVIDTVAGRPEIEVAGEAADGRAALELIRAEAPDVAVLDIRMPGLDGVAVLGAVRRDELATRVLLLSAQFTSESVYAALGAGAAGFLSKDATGDEIGDAIVAVAQGETILSGDVQAALAEEVRRRTPSDRGLLTAREREVIRLTADGLSGPEIGKRLHLSPTTVKTHLQRAYEKLGVSDRAAAVAEAMRRGLLE